MFHKKDFDDYKDGMRLLSVSLDRYKMVGIASLICLMQREELPDSVMVAFLKNAEDKKTAVRKLTKLLRKTKRTYRAIVLDVTNTGWEEGCDYTIENCYLTKRMYKNLFFNSMSGRWKIIPEDREMLKGILYTNGYYTENASIKNECDDYRECGVYCFSFCLPVEGSIKKEEGLTINLHRLGFYMERLVVLAKKKI